MSSEFNESNKTGLLLKSGAWYTVSGFLTRAMVFITMPIFTRLMTKAEYGTFSVYATWQVILFTVLGLEVYSVLNRARFDFTRKEELQGFITSSLLLSTLFTGAFFVIYLISPSAISRAISLDGKYIVAMLIYIFTYPAFMMFQSEQRINYKYKLSSAIAFVVTIASSILALLLVKNVESDRLMARIVGQYSLYCICGIVFYAYYIKRSTNIKLEYIKYALRFGVPLALVYLGSQIMQLSDILVVKKLCVDEEVAYISVVHTCSHIVLLLVQALNSAWNPWFFDMLKVGENRKIKQVFSVYLCGMLFMTIGVILIGPEIIRILGGQSYAEAIYIVPPAMLIGVCSVLTSQFGGFETYHKKPEYTAILTGIVAILNLILNIVATKIWGYRAVCYTTVLCQIILIALHYMLTLRLGIKTVISVKVMVAVIISAVAVIPVALWLYDGRVMIRCASIVLLALLAIAIMIRYRSVILSVLKRSKKQKS